MGSLVKIVSFSGIDGAGKTTQITALQTWLDRSGRRTRLLTFWDDIVILSRFREFLSHKAFKGDQGIGSPEKPLVRRDKNVTSWPVIAMRFFLYAGDAFHLAVTVRRLRRGNADVIIFDRYIYDELANLPLNRWLARAFVRLVAALIPKPDVAYVIDADPAAAFARKPEYPLEFVRNNREAYLTLSRLTGAITVIAPSTVDAMAANVRDAFLRASASRDADFPGLPALE
jgi:thymidylate kinase